MHLTVYVYSFRNIVNTYLRCEPKPKTKMHVHFDFNTAMAYSKWGEIKLLKLRGLHCLNCLIGNELP